MLTLCLCLIQVQPKHVKEAFRLLNKSIIRVETPDINLDQEEEDAMEEEDEHQENGKEIPANHRQSELNCSDTNWCICIKKFSFSRPWRAQWPCGRSCEWTGEWSRAHQRGQRWKPQWQNISASILRWVQAHLQPHRAAPAACWGRWDLWLSIGFIFKAAPLTLVNNFLTSTTWSALVRTYSVFVCRWGGRCPKKECSGELVPERDRVWDRLWNGAHQQEGHDREGHPQACALRKDFFYLKTWKKVLKFHDHDYFMINTTLTFLNI